FFAAVILGGIQAIPQSQYEPGQVLRLRRLQTVTQIILPQLVKIVLPSLGNEIINLLKDTSLIYVLGLGDLLRAGKITMCCNVTLVPLALVAVI
ncbi:ABC transporter permease subunit, partial [Enterococcus faecalis]|uniref:ABC transporter permease subunit n=1 Tax=Enterococcus faecalis TaxID=1351 RepID=UPI003D6A35C5